MGGGGGLSPPPPPQAVNVKAMIKEKMKHEMRSAAFDLTMATPFLLLRISGR